MDNILIHIGIHKAGSTWLQKHLFTAEYGFNPLISQKAQTIKEARKFFIYTKEKKLLSPFQDRTSEAHQYAATCPIQKDHIPVISSERLSGNPHASNFDAKAIADRIHKAYPNAKILIIIREQIAALLSTYFQYLRSGGHRGYKHYFSKHYDGRRPGFSYHSFEYHHLINYYQTLFGSENVLSLPMESLFHKKHNMLENILSFAGTKKTKLDHLPLRQKSNQRLPEYIEYKTRYLNLLRKSDSVNGYTLESIRYCNPIIKEIRKKLHILSTEKRNKRIRDEITAYVLKEFGEAFSQSNKITEKLISTPLKSTYRYL